MTRSTRRVPPSSRPPRPARHWYATAGTAALAATACWWLGQLRARRPGTGSGPLALATFLAKILMPAFFTRDRQDDRASTRKTKKAGDSPPASLASPASPQLPAESSSICSIHGRSPKSKAIALERRNEMRLSTGDEHQAESAFERKWLAVRPRAALDRERSNVRRRMRS
jgi:hypothetical protein